MSLWVLGVCCVILAFIAKDQKALILVFYLIGKSSVGVAFVVVWLITNETYPTNLRTQALGICSTVGENRKKINKCFYGGADILEKKSRQSHLGHIGKSQVGQLVKKYDSVLVTLVKDVQGGHIGN